MALGWFGGAGIAFIHQEYFLVDSFSNAAGYQLLAFWGGLGIFVSTAFTAIGTHSQIPIFMYLQKDHFIFLPF